MTDDSRWATASRAYPLDSEVFIMGVDKPLSYIEHMNIVGLDFETFSDVNLQKHGADRYFASDQFRPLLAAIDAGEDPDVYDFVMYPNADLLRFLIYIEGIAHKKVTPAAHNAAFEARTLEWMTRMDPHTPKNFYPYLIDTAVISSVAGASRSLSSAGPQLLGVPKDPAGLDLIKKFSIPNEDFDFKPVTREHLLNSDTLMHDWMRFVVYCAKDAYLSRMIADTIPFSLYEQKLSQVTDTINTTGWSVDVSLVKEMKRKYEDNLQLALYQFRLKHDPKNELNLNSLKQLKEWCFARGVIAKSFDERNVAKLLTRIEARLMTETIPHKIDGYRAVSDMLRTKQVLGGSSLKKLDVILNTVGEDYRLRNQYLHAGAGQTRRTSGRGVQMQNLKRLPPNPLDMKLLYTQQRFSNDELAANLRQVFKASGSPSSSQLVVGDFASVESRGLAWLAGENWKLKEYEDGKDMYKVLASSMLGVAYDAITPSQRTTGKVGELACGYGAGPEAVRSFAEGMNVDITSEEALDIVRQWREANPRVVDLWNSLHTALEGAVRGERMALRVGKHRDFLVVFTPQIAPDSLRNQHPGAVSIRMELVRHHVDSGAHRSLMTRVFQGVYQRGEDICYYKPSDRKTGDLWSATYTNPKTKRKEFHKLYGGKLAGILTQSFCRELFFSALMSVWDFTTRHDGIKLVGQFHDEIVVEVDEAASDATAFTDFVKREMQRIMSFPSIKDQFIRGFPLVADLQGAWRYIK